MNMSFDKFVSHHIIFRVYEKSFTDLRWTNQWNVKCKEILNYTHTESSSGVREIHQ